MIYTDLTKHAMKIAFDAHKEQLDKGGIPYIYHPIHLAEQMDDEISACVALLHDVVEDTDMTIEDISNFGFPNEVVAALQLLTHGDNITYLEYVKKIKENEISKKVKLADLAHNCQISRITSDFEVDEKTQKRLMKYFNALIILNYDEQNKDSEYFVMDNRRLVMLSKEGFRFSSISNNGKWEDSSEFDVCAYLDGTNDYVRFDVQI